MNTNAVELIFRTLCDPTPGSGIDATYLFGQTSGNQESSFSGALTSMADKIWVLDTQPRSGYPGYASWKQALKQIGIPNETIEAVPMPDDILLNTRTESQALIRHAMKKGIRSLEIIAPPFHQLRAFMTAVTIALEEAADLAIYSRPGTALPWHENVAHSQGTLEAQRSQLIHEEVARIEIYQNKGDLASFDEVLNYLNQRK